MIERHIVKPTAGLLLLLSVLGLETVFCPRLEAQSDARIIAEDNLADVRGLLIEPLAVWIARGLLVLKMQDRIELPLDLSLSDQALRPEELAGLSVAELRALRPRRLSIDSDPKLLLLQTKLSMSRARVSLYEVDFAWFSLQAVSRRAVGFVLQEQWLPSSELRPEPTAAPEASKAAAKGEHTLPLIEAKGVLAQAHVLRLTEPAVVAGYSQLLWRSTEGEEQFFSFSPVIAKLRRLTPSVRSDLILQSQLNGLDLFAFGENLADLDAELLGRYEKLVLFASEVPLIAEAVKIADNPGVRVNVPGRYQLLDGRSSMMRWNGDQEQFEQFAPWMPLSAIAVPRSVLVFKLNTRDPFASFGREVLIVDEASMLPVYKLVYSKWGSLERVLIAFWAAAIVQEQSAAEAIDPEQAAEAIPVLAGVLGVAANAAQATAMSTRAAAFSEYSALFERRRFLLPESLPLAVQPEVSAVPEEGDSAPAEETAATQTLPARKSAAADSDLPAAVEEAPAQPPQPAVPEPSL